MFRPLIRLPSSNHYLETEFNIETLEQLDKIQWLLIPSLQLVGVEATDPNKRQQFEQQKRKFNMKNMFFGAKGVFDSVAPVEMASPEDILEFNANVTVNIDLPSETKEATIKAIQEYIDTIKASVLLRVTDKKIQKPLAYSDEPLPKGAVVKGPNGQYSTMECQVALPQTRSDSKNTKQTTKNITSLRCTTPIKFLVHLSNLKVSTLIDVLCKELSSSLKIMTRNDFLYRRVYKQNGLILNNYSKTKDREEKPKAQSEGPVASQAQHRQNAAPQNNNKMVVMGLVILLSLYVFIRFYLFKAGNTAHDATAEDGL